MTVNRFRYFVQYTDDAEELGCIMFVRYDHATRTCVYFLTNSGDTIYAPLCIEELESLVVTKKLFEVNIRTFNSYPEEDPHPIFILEYNNGSIQVLYFARISRTREYTILSRCAVTAFLEKDLKTYTEVDINEKIRLEKLHFFIHKMNPLKQVMVSEYRLRSIKQMYEEKGSSLSKEFNEIPLGHIIVDDAIMNNTFIQMYL